ncbi:MAG: tetratricopeptide repeat protein, partial [Prevotella sp.]|nr:tetratricopeptide repeat protein [Prevotella sp.]
VKTNEQLYLTGLHLEQYRHATWSPVDYYEEGLRRDPNDIRCLNALGLWYIRKGRFSRAEEYLRKAVRLITKRNPNPYDGEPIYNLALALKYQGKVDEAYEWFWKSTWNKAWADAGYFEAAKISVMQGRYEEALDEIDRCLNNNWHNHKARALKAAILRKLDDKDEALTLIEESLNFDLFNYGCRYEKYLLTHDKAVLDEMTTMLRRSAQNYDEVALDYCAAGLYDEARALWDIAVAEGAASPMTYYYVGWVMMRQGDAVEANAWFELAEKKAPDYCFPNRLEDVQALSLAVTMNPDGARAPYYLGCLYYAARQYDIAIEKWELSARLDPSFPIVWRNLALGRFNKQNRQQEALEYMERAFHLNEDDERVLMELDQLYKRMHRPHQERLAFMQQYPELIRRRDDLVLEEITLLNQTGHYEEAMQKLDAHTFHPWEGGEGKVPAQYQICRVELAKQAILAGKGADGLGADKEYNKAISLLSECLTYPHHLGEGKLYGAQENDFYYLLGVAYDALGQHDKARECWEEATKGPQEPAAAMYYNDAKADKIFYQGMALYKLGRDGEAHGRFYKLINYGKQHIFEKQVMDYFAVSLPDLLIWEDSLDMKNLIHCKYMLALGYYGMGDTDKALKYLAEVEALDNNHQGIQQFRTLIDAR